MKKFYDDNDYIKIVYDILNHKDFQKLINIIHHGDNRFDHSIRVSYYSYKLTKFLKLNYKDVARAGLLHDFFFEDNEYLNRIDKIKTLIHHPNYAYDNAKKYFELSIIEEDIIKAHMFPIGKYIPKYLESWIVDIIDDFVSIYEKIHVTSRRLSTAYSFIIFIIINNFR